MRMNKWQKSMICYNKSEYIDAVFENRQPLSNIDENRIQGLDEKHFKGY